MSSSSVNFTYLLTEWNQGEEFTGILPVLRLYITTADVSMDLVVMYCYYAQRNERETAFLCSSTRLFKKIHSLEYYKAFLFPTQHVIVHLWIILCSETNVMHFLFNLLSIKGLYMFQALLAMCQLAAPGTANWHNTQAIYKVRLVQDILRMSK
jgi:hypothetical protein